MRRTLSIGLVVAALVGAGLFTLWPASAQAPGADFALLDETGGDTQVGCRGYGVGPFRVHGSFRAITGDAVLRVLFRDGDFVDYPIPLDTSFSFTHGAGGTPEVDDVIRVTNAGTAPGELVGWLSASPVPGFEGSMRCATA